MSLSLKRSPLFLRKNFSHALSIDQCSRFPCLFESFPIEFLRSLGLLFDRELIVQSAHLTPIIPRIHVRHLINRLRRQFLGEMIAHRLPGVLRHLKRRNQLELFSFQTIHHLLRSYRPLIFSLDPKLLIIVLIVTRVVRLREIRPKHLIISLIQRVSHHTSLLIFRVRRPVIIFWNQIPPFFLQFLYLFFLFLIALDEIQAVPVDFLLLGFP